jgi:hypothetical protein
MGAMIGAAAAIGSSIIGGMSSAHAQSSANAANARQSRLQMLFQQNMSNTAHQREVADLRAAGLNPVLSATGGQGASTPAGSAAHIEPENPMEYVLKTVDSLASAFKIKSETELMEKQKSATVATTQKTGAETNNINSQTTLNKLQQLKVSAETQNLYQDIQNKVANVNKTLQDTRMGVATENLLKSQNVNESIRSKILNQDLAIGASAAADALVNKEITESTFGETLMYIKRAADTAGAIKLPAMRRR